jgi:uncharacterized protein
MQAGVNYRNTRSEIVATIMTNCTCGKENPERATLPFIVGNVAASADQQAIVLLTVEGVWIATKEYAEEIHKEGFQPLKEIIDSFLANGGQIWACGACTKPRGITDEHLIPGAKIVTAAMVVEAMVNGASTLGF